MQYTLCGTHAHIHKRSVPFLVLCYMLTGILALQKFLTPCLLLVTLTLLCILYIHAMVVAVHCYEVNYVHVGYTLCEVTTLHENQCCHPIHAFCSVMVTLFKYSWPYRELTVQYCP